MSSSRGLIWITLLLCLTVLANAMSVTDIIPTSTSSFEVLSNVTLSVNAIDSANVSANITSPAGIITQLRLTNTSSIFNGTFVPTSIGLYNITFIASNETESNSTQTTSFYSNDTTAPVLTINTPVNGTVYNAGQTIVFSANATDFALSSVKVNLTLPNGTILLGNLSNVLGKYQGSYLIPSQLGRYDAIFSAADAYNNTNNTATYFIVNDSIAPTITGIVPSYNASYETLNTIEISANVNDAVGISSVLANVLYPNATTQLLNLTNVSATKYSTNFIIPELAGQYTVTFYANDTSNNLNTTTSIFQGRIPPLPSFTITAGLLGSDNQNRDVNTTSTVTIKNNATTAMNITALVFQNTEAKYVLKILDLSLPITLSAGETRTLTLSGFVPVDFNAVDSNLNEAAFKIASLTATGSNRMGQISNSADVTMQAINKLHFKKGEIVINNAKSSFNDNSSKEIRPSDEGKIILDYVNDFSNVINDLRNTNIDIDADVDIVYDDDVSLEFDETTDSQSLSADDTVSSEFGYNIANDARARTLKLTLKLTGRDQYGAKHGEVWHLDLEIKKYAIDLFIKSLAIEQVKCGSSATVRAEILNRGKNDITNAALQVQVPSLSISGQTPNFAISEGESTQLLYSIPIPAKTAAGVYTANVYTIYDVNKKSDSGSTSFEVICESTIPAPAAPTTTTTTTNTQTQTNTTQTTNSTKTATTLDNGQILLTTSQTSNVPYVWILVGAAVLVVVLGAGFFYFTRNQN